MEMDIHRQASAAASTYVRRTACLYQVDSAARRAGNETLSSANHGMGRGIGPTVSPRLVERCPEMDFHIASGDNREAIVTVSDDEVQPVTIEFDCVFDISDRQCRHSFNQPHHTFVYVYGLTPLPLQSFFWTGGHGVLP